jgi:hypothetical protein
MKKVWGLWFGVLGEDAGFEEDEGQAALDGRAPQWELLELWGVEVCVWRVTRVRVACGV